MSEQQIEFDAGCVVPSPARYRVTFTHQHKTLNEGDVVVMVEAPNHVNLLLRESDMTLHRLQDRFEQYVHLVNS